MKLRALSLLSSLLLASPLLAQDAPFKENVDVNLVLLDSVVTDRHGNQILGLGKDDFIVAENGVTQPVESLDYFTNRRLLNTPEKNAPFNVEQVRGDRYFVLFFDKPNENQLWSELAVARAAAIDLIEHQLQPEDRVAVAGHDVRLKIYSDFTTDRKQLCRAIDEVAKFGLGLRAGGSAEEPSILRHIGAEEMVSGTGTVYEGLTLLADSMRSIHARKNLILFSAGLYEPGETISRSGLLTSPSRFYEPMIQALNAANVSVYALNLFRDTSEDLPARHQTLGRMADETNGQYFRYAVNFKTPLRQIESANNGYYLIGYHSRHSASENGYQKVNVTLKNSEFRIRSRDGYVYGSDGLMGRR